MSNRRRHFPFGGGHKSPTSADSPTSSPSSYEMGKSRFHLSLADPSPFNEDTNSFSTNIHKCLTSCASYTQALNTLCGTGTHFAQCLVNLFHNLHPYQEIAGQFLDVWENLSKATGSASAAVKTETLINLHDILTRLESNEENQFDVNGSAFNSVENIQVLFTCLNSFLQLQALFSCSSWESLDKLSRNIEESQDCSAAHPSLQNKVINNNHPNENISGHFKPLLSRLKPYQSSTTISSSSTFNKNCPIPNEEDVSYQSLQSTNVNTSPSRVWKNATVPSSDNSRSETPLSCASSPKKSFQDSASKNFASAEELQDVLELLSCRPDSSDIAQSCPSLLDKSLQSISSQVKNTEDSISSTSQGLTIGVERETHRQDYGKRTWPRVNGNVNPANWGWMFAQSSNENVFQYGGSCSDFMSDPPDTRNSLNERGLDSVMLANGMHHHDHHQDPVAQSSFIPRGMSPTHQKQPSDVSVASDGQTKSWSSTQGDSSSSSEDTGLNDTENVFSIGLNIVVSDLVASVRQRRHSSTDGLPDSEDIDPVLQASSNNTPIDSTRMAKTSTWPLKQHNSRTSNQSSLFFGHDSLDCPSMSPGAPLWNFAPIVGTSPYPPGMEHAKMEKYSLFGKSN